MHEYTIYPSIVALVLLSGLGCLLWVVLTYQTKIQDARAALLDANARCRSAYMISVRILRDHARGGIAVGTDFKAFSAELEKSLIKQNAAIEAMGGYPIGHEIQ